MYLSKLLASRKAEIGKSLAEIGQDVGVSRATVHDYTSGVLPPKNRLDSLAESLGLDPKRVHGEFQFARAMRALNKAGLDHVSSVSVAGKLREAMSLPTTPEDKTFTQDFGGKEHE